MVNSPLIRPYLLGGVALGGYPWVPMIFVYFWFGGMGVMELVTWSLVLLLVRLIPCVM